MLEHLPQSAEFVSYTNKYLIEHYLEKLFWVINTLTDSSRWQPQYLRINYYGVRVW